MKRIRLLYLYTEVMGYTLATIRELVVGGGVEVHVVHWDRGKLTPFQPESFEGVHLYTRSTLSGQRLGEFVQKLAPDLAVVSGWQDRGYLPVARQLRRQGVPVVVGFDDQWKGTMRQRVATWASALLGTFFSHAWVTGPLQYEYARRMGFPTDRIIHDLYSADLRQFSRENKNRAENVGSARRIVFVGRLERVKGIDVLLEAWACVHRELPEWELLIIGNGSLEPWVSQAGNVRQRPFSAANDVVKELSKAAAFVLPSRHEPWGVVLHEAVALGLPILCSTVVGAAATFVIDGYNGYLFRPNDPIDLARAIRVFTSVDGCERRVMAERSVELSRRITPVTSAANLMSLLPTRFVSSADIVRTPISGRERGML